MGSGDFFKGLRFNLTRSFVKDYMTAAYYLRIHRFFEQSSLFRQIENEKLRFFASSVGAAHISSLFFTLVLTPFDVAKTKAMCEIAPKATSEYKRVWRTLGGLAMKEGFPGLWRGSIYGMANSLVQSIALVIGSHWLSREVRLDVPGFFALNAVIAGVLYPIDTIT